MRPQVSSSPGDNVRMTVDDEQTALRRELSDIDNTLASLRVQGSGRPAEAEDEADAASDLTNIEERNALIEGLGARRRNLAARLADLERDGS